MAVLNHLEPQRVFRFFEELCAIPHGSGNTKAVSFILDKGEVTGDVEAEESITVEPGSVLTGNITAESARINGTIQGNLKITGQLTLCSKAVLNGDLVAGSVIMEAGCVVKGHFQVG